MTAPRPLTARVPVPRRDQDAMADQLPPDAGRRTSDGRTLADAVARLAAEFPGRGVGLVSDTVRQCRRDLDGTPPGAMPELLERSARQRLRCGGPVRG
jgi:hypothetical protein